MPVLFFVLIAFGVAGTVRADAQSRSVNPGDLTRDAILYDPAAPTLGNPKGDVTIVAFEDYNCPYCKKADPALAKLVKTDGHIRLVYKDWPILAPSSTYGAELALAAKYQGKYESAHDALMHIPSLAGGIGKQAMDKALEDAGIDMTRLDKDLAAHLADIRALIRRNDAQATGMGFAGTPVFLVGPYLVAAALDYGGFKKVVAAARAKQQKGEEPKSKEPKGQ